MHSCTRTTTEHKHGLPAQRAVPVVDPRAILEDRGWFPRAAGRPKAMRIGSRSEIGRVEATQNLYRLNGPARCTLRVSPRRQHVGAETCPASRRTSTM